MSLRRLCTGPALICSTRILVCRSGSRHMPHGPRCHDRPALAVHRRPVYCGALFRGRGDMDETRRDLFRTSLVSTVGGLIAGAVAGVVGGAAVVRSMVSSRPLD